MFEVLAFLCDHYGHVALPPALDVLAPRLNALGYDQDQIDDAHTWLTELCIAADEWLHPQADSWSPPARPPSGASSRVYTTAEMTHLGTGGVGQLARWVHEGLLPSLLHEVVLERAMATPDSPVQPAQLHLVVQMVCWYFGRPPLPGHTQSPTVLPCLPAPQSAQLH